MYFKYYKDSFVGTKCFNNVLDRVYILEILFKPLKNKVPYLELFYKLIF